jgi:hypothetical protein
MILIRFLLSFPWLDPNQDAKDHVVRFNQAGDNYKKRPEDGSPYLEDVITASSLDPQFRTKRLVDFWCRNTCLKESVKRDRRLRFEFFDAAGDQLLGVYEFFVRVCASPARDLKNEEDKDNNVFVQPESRKRKDGKCSNVSTQNVQMTCLKSLIA